MLGNYGDFTTLPRISFYGDYLAAEYYLPSKKIYTVGVYSIKDDVSQKSRILKRSLSSKDTISPVYEKMLGGREFEDCNADPFSPFVVYFSPFYSESRVLVPSVDYFEHAVLLEVNDQVTLSV
jgi:hypothetical protein